ncbi:late endosomal/lysosomal adaptor and MAPK and MTOR activator-domain-containing protein [Annulohypoxylon maeteangense]|uniref:late endosomal/lysosomal adaptor and MAPK and MTOR activator-domain-containing protein n=1 Tax=Annulohypoxylon maeteangense TaxID=1927788 RepID=UPI0020080D4F|nr:late endosomal/lysosomal adaptor and MAPK and MTOR activator-domain-containing protein [Annulohypoxylon maeteangense]KAI0888243.1 late endosomal/lysosomal adaptor and MAPK and MTOR activator-domain-containing protein [Annulohypoxylon maeteangense]
MGICASCLGSRRRDSYDEDDVSRLLFDDPNNLQYGSFSEHNMNSQADPLESQREVEALQRVVARTSNNLVDVFEIAPQESQRTQPALFSGQDARMARYQNILAKLSTERETTSADGGPGTVEWLLSEDDTVELQGHLPGIKDEVGGPLVGTFADITAARA